MESARMYMARRHSGPAPEVQATAAEEAALAKELGWSVSSQAEYEHITFQCCVVAAYMPLLGYSGPAKTPTFRSGGRGSKTALQRHLEASESKGDDGEAAAATVRPRPEAARPLTAEKLTPQWGEVGQDHVDWSKYIQVANSVDPAQRVRQQQWGGAGVVIVLLTQRNHLEPRQYTGKLAFLARVHSSHSLVNEYRRQPRKRPPRWRPAQPDFTSPPRPRTAGNVQTGWCALCCTSPTLLTHARVGGDRSFGSRRVDRRCCQRGVGAGQSCAAR